MADWAGQMALTLKVGEVKQGRAYCTTEREAAPFRPASVAELHPGRPARVAQLCALETLADRGTIRACQLRAGREVRDYWRVWTCQLLGQVRAKMKAEGEKRVAMGERFKFPVYDSLAVRAQSKRLQPNPQRLAVRERTR